MAGFNAFIKSQLDVPGDANLTLVLFDDEYLMPHSSVPVQNVPELTAATYVPRGSTALLDAIGRTIKETDARLSKLAEAEQPGKVIVAIFTDGEENASQEYSLKHIGDLIRLYRDTKGWEFLFLAANQDAIATAGTMHMSLSLSSNVSYDYKGVKSTGGALSRKVRSMRMKSSGNMDAQAVEDDAKSMNDIVKEEEQKPD